MTHPFTIQAKAAQKILTFASSYGVSTKDLCDAVSFDPSVLLDPDSRIPFGQLVDLYEKAAELTRDQNFGLHVGMSVDLGAFDVVGYSALHSATLGEAFARVARYHSIWTDGAVINVESSGSTTRVSYHYVDTSFATHRQDSEMTFATAVALCRGLADPNWKPMSVEFQHPAPTDTGEHAILFRAPVKFGATENCLVVESGSLSLPIAKADASLCAVLDRHAEELLARFPPPDSLVDHCRCIIGRELNGGNPSLEHIAAELGMSARTLQRKLQEHDTSHNEVLDQTRRELAIRYLREREMAICEVAYLLGFSEPSSFHRAFKRWTGVTPKEYRVGPSEFSH